jgi:hypothetical protein
MAMTSNFHWRTISSLYDIYNPVVENEKTKYILLRKCPINIYKMKRQIVSSYVSHHPISALKTYIHLSVHEEYSGKNTCYLLSLGHK